MEGMSFKVPNAYLYTLEGAFIFGGMYSIPECQVKSGDIVFDVGAHFGFFSYYAVQKGANEAYAFEPNPYVFEVLKKNAEMWSDRIKPYPVALSSQNGESDLFIADELGTISTMLKNRESTPLKLREYTKSVKVKTMTIDNFVKEEKIDRVDFIKIDTEGFEKEIIKGAEKTIKEFKPRLAIAAYHFPDDKKAIPELVLSIRDDYNYKLVNKGEGDLFFLLILKIFKPSFT
jgi:FkbM family methyltransferase